EGALARKADDSRLLRFKAQIHEQGGDLGGAAAQYRRLAELEPQSRTAHIKEVARLELELGRADAAKQAAEDLIRFAPGSTDGLRLLADIAFRTGAVEDGLEALRRAVRIDARDVEIRMMLAGQLAQHQQINEAIEHYWRSFEL